MRFGFALLLFLAASVSIAQGTYPAKPVRIIVTFTPGGAADFTARLVADKWSELWQQQVIVENRIGAGGNIGAEAVYKAPADGYALLLVASAHAFNAALYPNLPFDIVKDFVPLGLATSTPMALAVNPRMTVAHLKEFTALLQAKPHQIQYATCGVATAHHFAMELYKFQTKTDAVHVPYRGCGPAVVDAVGGQIEVVMSSLTTVLPHAKAGKLRTLAITSENRSASAPEIPTFSESGVPVLNMRLAAPDHIVDLNGVSELAYISEQGEALVIGAMTRQRDVEFDARIRARCPLMHEAVLQVGHRQTRNRGTLGGSLCHLDPSAELVAVAAALDAVVTVQGPSGVRDIAFTQFPAGLMTPALREGELLTAVRFPLWRQGHGHAFVEFSRRHGDFAIVSAAVLLEEDASGR